MMNQNLLTARRLLACLALCCGAAALPSYAAVSNLVIEQFDDATLEPGLTIQGVPTIGGGVATLADVDDAVVFDASALVVPGAANYSLSSSIIVETVVDLSLTGGPFETVIDLIGQSFIRESNTVAQFGLWDGAIEVVYDEDPLPTTTAHFALVYDADAITFDYYLNGVLTDTIIGLTPGDGTTLFTFGNINHHSVTGGRVGAGDYDVVAVSTFTGGFDPASDFVLPTGGFVVTGDTDGDGDIDDFDLLNAISNFTGSLAPGAGGKGVPEGDTDTDTDVDDFDLLTMISGFTGSLASPSVPEPASLALMLGLYAIGMLRRRR